MRFSGRPCIPCSDIAYTSARGNQDCNEFDIVMYGEEHIVESTTVTDDRKGFHSVCINGSE